MLLELAVDVVDILYTVGGETVLSARRAIGLC